MKNDNRIAATILDAIYIGKTHEGFIYDTEYRLRAVRSPGGVVKIKVHKPEGPIELYGSAAHFEANWSNVRRIVAVLW